ncbi:MAG: hypothetical protein J6Q17_06425 [Clostridia bacterium]|nr:hypothetical protein [Clostridia bacterium]
MRKTTSKRLICCVLSILTFVSTLPGFVFAAEEAEEAPQKSTLQEISESLVSYSYADYREDYADAKKGTGTVAIKATDYLASDTTAEVEVVSDYNGKSGKSLLIHDDGRVTWEFNVPAEASTPSRLTTARSRRRRTPSSAASTSTAFSRSPRCATWS